MLEHFALVVPPHEFFADGAEEDFLGLTALGSSKKAVARRTRILGFSDEYSVSAAAAQEDWSEKPAPSSTRPPKNPLLVFVSSRMKQSALYRAKASLVENGPKIDVRLTEFDSATRNWAARLYSFAVPTGDLVRLLEVASDLGGGRGDNGEVGLDVVEVGAGLGYIASYLRSATAAARSATTTSSEEADPDPPRHGTRSGLIHSYRAVDLSPAESGRVFDDEFFSDAGASRNSAVQRCDDEFRVLNSETESSTCVLTKPENGWSNPSPPSMLLLSFPPPASAMAATALDRFDGEFVLYIGEWATGMTGDAAFHADLLENFELVALTKLPQWPTTCYYAFLFRRASSNGKSAPSHEDPEASVDSLSLAGFAQARNELKRTRLASNDLDPAALLLGRRDHVLQIPYRCVVCGTAHSHDKPLSRNEAGNRQRCFCDNQKCRKQASKREKDFFSVYHGLFETNGGKDIWKQLAFLDPESGGQWQRLAACTPKA